MLPQLWGSLLAFISEVTWARADTQLNCWRGEKTCVKRGPPPQYFQSFYCKRINYMKVQPKGCWEVSQPSWKPVAQGRPLALASLWHRSSVQVPVPEIKRRTHRSLCWLGTCWKRFPIWLGAGLLSSHWPKWKNTQICNKNVGLLPVTYVVFWVHLESLLSDRNSDSRERQHKQLWSQSEGGTTERKVLLHTLHHCKRCIFPYHLEQWYGKISLRTGENPTLKSMPKSKDSFWQFYSCLTTNHAH